MKRYWSLFLVVLIAVEITVLAASYLHRGHQMSASYGFPLDDSWIYAQFARNIGEGNGIIYNPGQPMSPTGIIYGLLLGGVYRVLPDPVLGAALLGLILHLATAVLVYRTARILALGRPVATGCAMLFAAIPRMIWGGLSGMEVPVYVFFVTLGIYWHIRYRRHNDAHAYLPTLAFALAALARPECGSFIIASLIDRLICCLMYGGKEGEPARFAKTIPLHAVLAAVVVLPWALFNLHATGLPLPPAFYAKTRPLTGLSLIDAISIRAKFAVVFLSQAMIASMRDSFVLYLGMLLGLGVCIAWTVKRKREGVLILALAFIVPPMATALTARGGAMTAQLLMQVGRYSGYLAPLLVLLGAVGFHGVWKAMDRLPGRWNLARHMVFPIVGVIAAVTLVQGNALMAQRYAMQVQNINDMQVALGKWAAQLPKGTVLAVNDAGAIPYFSHKPIVDTIGVVNPEVVPYLRKYHSRQRGLLEYLEKRKPDYVIIFPKWYPALSHRSDVLTPIKEIHLAHNIVCGGDTMVVYKPVWNKRVPTGTQASTLNGSAGSRQR